MYRSSINTVARSIRFGSGFSSLNLTRTPVISRLAVQNLNKPAFQGLSSRFFSTGNVETRQPLDKELSTFLDEEIRNEKEQSATVTGISGFEIKNEGATLILSKQHNSEKISIRVNVNGSVVGEEGAEQPADESENYVPQMHSKPDFAIEIRKPGQKVFCIHCVFSGAENEEPFDGQPEQQQQQDLSEDLFEIDTFFFLDDSGAKLEVGDETYCGDATIIDGQLYDLLMDYLDERGIGNDFASALIKYCTAYEHKLYVNLLGNLKQFVDTK